MLLCPLVSAQVLVDARRAAEILQHFEPQAAATLTCDFTPVTPVMTFTYRFQAGYLVRVSLTQFHGPGHWIAVLLRVTPRADESQPVYFLRTFDLPDVPATDFSAEVAGAFLVGEGHYEANAIVFDDSHRACRADWQIEVKGTDRHRIVNLPNSVGPISEAAWWAPTSDAPIARLTVFLHVAPLNARMLNLRASDSVMAVASLMALLERLPARAVRLVVFNLHREKEIYRTEFFTLNDLDEVTRALDGLQLGLVNYQALQHQNEQRQLLRNLIHREVNEPSHSSLVVFLGPTDRMAERMHCARLICPDRINAFSTCSTARLRLGAKASRRFAQSMTADLTRHLLAKLSIPMAATTPTRTSQALLWLKLLTHCQVR